MATQTRVPGAASSEVDFELERFERTAQDRIEISGRWYGLRGRRFVRPVLNLNAGGARRRAIALLEHKPWAADDGQTWLAAFRWPEGAGDVSGAELEVGPGLVVELPAPGGKPGAAGRVSALRPHVPTPPRRQFHAADEGLGGDGDGAAGEPRGRELSGRAAPDTSDFAAGTAPEWTPAPAREASRGRAAAPEWGSAPARDSSGGRAAAPGWAPAPPRDVLTAALAERDEAFAERDRLTTELERVTRERDIAYAERSRTLQDSEAVERARDQAAAERDGARSELARAIPAREDAIRERDAEAARADQAESERDTAFAERKSAVAQRDRARRERDRAMRAAGVEPPDESPYVATAGRGGQPAEEAPDGRAAGDAPELDPAAPPSAATPPGTPLPSRPVKRIGTAPAGPAPEAKPLLTPVDAGRPRRLSRTRRTPSAPARWAVRATVLLLLIAIAVVLVMLLARAM